MNGAFENPFADYGKIARGARFVGRKNTYPMQLFEIILAEWNRFKDIFGRDKQYWNQRAEFIAKIRNPLAHNREEALQEYELKIAEGYCEEILDAIHALKQVRERNTHNRNEENK